MDFTNEINTLESEKLRLEEMLKRNNDRLQLLRRCLQNLALMDIEDSLN